MNITSMDPTFDHMFDPTFDHTFDHMFDHTFDHMFDHTFDPTFDHYADRLYTLEVFSKNPMKIAELRPITGICGTLRMYPIVNQATYDELFEIESRMNGPKPKQ